MKRELTKQDKNFNKEKFNEWVKQFINEWGHQWGFGFYIKTTNNEVIYQGTNEFKQWRDGKLEEYINNKMSSKEQNKPLQQPLVNSSLPTEEQVLQTIFDCVFIRGIELVDYKQNFKNEQSGLYDALVKLFSKA